MQTRYSYNGINYSCSYQLRQAVWKEERFAYPDCKTQEDFTKLLELGLKNPITVEEYDPLDEMPIESLRWQVTQRMRMQFNEYCTSRYTSVNTSLGFPVNGNTDAVSNIDMCISQFDEGLIQTQAEGERTIEFRDFNDEMQSVTEAQLRLIKAEVSQNLSRARQMKWQYETQIKDADREALKQMTVFSFMRSTELGKMRI